jgi:hypothetical protein
MDAQRFSTVPLPPQTPAPSSAADPDALRAAARAMLARIGWDAGQRLQDAVYARMPLPRKMAIALRWRETQLTMLRRQLAAGHPDASPARLRELTLERLEWAREPRPLPARRATPAASASAPAGEDPGRRPEEGIGGEPALEEPPADLLTWVITALERLQVPYALAGSVALIAWATPRTTHDIDILVDLPPQRIEDFCRYFPPERFYVDPDAMRAAFLQVERSLYNIIDMETGFKVDLSPVRPSDPLHARALSHRVRRELLPGVTAWVVSPEDLLLQKLEWYTLGQSERQFRDCLALLRAARSGGQTEIDPATIAAWAQRLGPPMEQAWALLQAALRETEDGAPEAAPPAPPA